MLVQYILEEGLRGQLAAATKLGIDVVMTSNPDVVRIELLDRFAKADRDKVEYHILNMVEGSRGLGFATGLTYVEGKKIFIYGHKKEYLKDVESIYSVLLHELGHIFPWPTPNECTAWRRAFSMASIITPRMWSFMRVTLGSYKLNGIEDEEKANHVEPLEKAFEKRAAAYRGAATEKNRFISPRRA